jgi:hypothetical protein
MNLASVSRGFPFQERITAGMATINQPLRRKRPIKQTEKSMTIIQKWPCAYRKYVIKTLRRQTFRRQKRSQGGVQLPTGGNCAQCA